MYVYSIIYSFLFNFTFYFVFLVLLLYICGPYFLSLFHKHIPGHIFFLYNVIHVILCEVFKMSYWCVMESGMEKVGIEPGALH